jgi:hypothetical protein
MRQIPIVSSIDVQIFPAGHPLPPLARQPSIHVNVASQTRPESAAPQFASVVHSAHTNGCAVITQIGRAAGQGLFMSHSSIGVVVGLPGVMPLPDG